MTDCCLIIECLKKHCIDKVITFHNEASCLSRLELLNVGFWPRRGLKHDVDWCSFWHLHRFQCSMKFTVVQVLKPCSVASVQLRQCLPRKKTDQGGRCRALRQARLLVSVGGGCSLPCAWQAGPIFTGHSQLPTPVPNLGRGRLSVHAGSSGPVRLGPARREVHRTPV